VGKELEVLIDDVVDNVAVGRCYADAPEIDGLVHVQKGGKLKVGQKVMCEIVGATEHDLIGVVHL
jgi:ribosomal protein S12 methylthiotransferase